MILETIADANRVRYEEIEKQVPLEVIKQKALSMETDNEFPFEKALAGKNISFICEVKKASPSKGIIAEDFPYVQIAKDYEKDVYKRQAAAVSLQSDYIKYIVYVQVLIVYYIASVNLQYYSNKGNPTLP